MISSIKKIGLTLLAVGFITSKVSAMETNVPVATTEPTTQATPAQQQESAAASSTPTSTQAEQPTTQAPAQPEQPQTPEATQAEKPKTPADETQKPEAKKGDNNGQKAPDNKDQNGGNGQNDDKGNQGGKGNDQKNKATSFKQKANDLFIDNKMIKGLGEKLGKVNSKLGEKTAAGLVYGGGAIVLAGIATAVAIAIKNYNKKAKVSKIKAALTKAFSHVDAINSENLHPELQAAIETYKEAQTDEERELVIDQLTKLITENASYMEELQTPAITEAATTEATSETAPIAVV